MMLRGIPLESPPPESGRLIYHKICEMTGNPDPYTCTDGPGTVLERCSEEFKKIYEHADFIISKGQGNYEALSIEKRPIFFLLRAKCQIIAQDIGVTERDIVLKGIINRRASEHGSQDADERTQSKKAA
jgi:uncharacterized protein with ATP-grasp and redox domains